jgi:photosystem II stability/assembly factor-like uncharacterized protein
MKQIIIFSILLLAKPLLADGWFLQTSNVSGISLWSVSFANSSTGYTAGGNGTILKTTNGGVNWITQTSGTTQELLGIYFTDPMTGWACGNNGVILNTTNGGTNWNTQNSGTSNNFETVYFPSATIGYCGGRFVISKTTNAGATWANLTITDDMTAMSFINTNTGWGCCWGGHMYATTNGGATWNQQNSGTLLHLHGIFFANALSGWATIDDPGAGGIIATTNGGTNWTFQLTGIPGQHSVFFINSSTGYTSGGNIYKTTNGGTNWELQIPPSGIGECTSVFFTNENTGWSVTLFGKIIATTTGGISGVKQIGGTVPGHFELAQNYPNPFNPETNIDFDLPKSSEVKLVIYSAAGKEIEIPVNGKLTAGKYSVNWNASVYASGVYFYRLVTPEINETKKMILVK